MLRWGPSLRKLKLTALGNQVRQLVPQPSYIDGYNRFNCILVLRVVKGQATRHTVCLALLFPRDNFPGQDDRLRCLSVQTSLSNFTAAARSVSTRTSTLTSGYGEQRNSRPRRHLVGRYCDKSQMSRCGRNTSSSSLFPPALPHPQKRDIKLYHEVHSNLK